MRLRACFLWIVVCAATTTTMKALLLRSRRLFSFSRKQTIVNANFQTIEIWLQSACTPCRSFVTKRNMCTDISEPELARSERAPKVPGSKEVKALNYLYTKSVREMDGMMIAELTELGAKYDGHRELWYIPDGIPTQPFSDILGCKVIQPRLYHYIDCSFEEKDKCKEMGALFDGGKKLWYFPNKQEAEAKGSPWPEYKFIYLDVPYDRKHIVKALGARWDAVLKTWFAKQSDVLEGHYDEFSVSSDLSGNVESGADFNSLSSSSSLSTSYSPNKSDAGGELFYRNGDMFNRDFVAEPKVPEPFDLEGKYVVFFDIETSGLPERAEFGQTHPIRKFKAYDSCRVIQICAMLCKAECLTEVETKNVLIKANDFEISEGSFSVHGITKEKTLEEGIDLKTALDDEIFPLFSKAEYVACHNAEFDTNVFKSELARGNFDDYLAHMEGMKVICTMKKTKDIIQARGKTNRLKNPNLKELYEFATKKEMEGHHDAMYDVKNMHEAVKALVESNQLHQVDLFGV